MAFPQIKIISWSPNDPITLEKMNAMVQNDQLLQDNMVRGFYSGASVTKDQGIRLASGLVMIPAGKSPTAGKAVNFNNFFSVGCRPIVTTGVVSQQQRQIFAVVDGSGSEVLPTYLGFNLNVYVVSNAKKKKITNNFYVTWMAMGW